MYKIPTVAQLVNSLKNMQISLHSQKLESSDVYLILTPGSWTLRRDGAILGPTFSTSLDVDAPKEEVQLLAERMLEDVYQYLEEKEAV